MTTLLKILAFAAMSIGTTFQAHAQPILFHSTLIVKEIAAPQVFVGRDKNPAQSTGNNTFTIKGRSSDYFFTVSYQHKGQSKEAVCEISGVPKQIIATINPSKEGRAACKTEEMGRLAHFH